ncbi:MAG: F0F1 ATP synthase subunit A [Nocardioides sp.]
MVLAVFTLLITIFNGNKHYWGHIFWMPGVPVPMKIFLMPLELIGVFTKPIALMIRLFANITAGHILGVGIDQFDFCVQQLLGNCCVYSFRYVYWRN